MQILDWKKLHFKQSKILMGIAKLDFNIDIISNIANRIVSTSDIIWDIIIGHKLADEVTFEIWIRPDNLIPEALLPMIYLLYHIQNDTGGTM